MKLPVYVISGKFCPKLGHPDGSVGSAFGFCIARYLSRAGSNLISDASKSFD